MNRIEKNRAEQLKHQGVKLNMKYDYNDEFGLYSLLKEFKLFRRGSRRKIRHILSDKKNHELKKNIFDYSYRIGSDKHRRTIRQTVMFINSKQLGLPQFSLQPEQLWNKLTNWLKLESDIDFEGYPDFSDSYLLKGDDEEIVRYIFTPEVLNFFTIHKNWHLEGIGYYLILYSRNERFHPEVIPGFHDMGMKMHELFKTHPDELKLS